jgi:subtilase family serine protease
VSAEPRDMQNPFCPGVCVQAVKWSFAALLISAAVSIPSFCATPDRITGALNSGETIALRGSVQHKALPQFDQGPADPALRFGSIMLLTIPAASQHQILTQLLAEQQDRKSPNYHKWLTPEQWANRFGLTPNDAQTITNWLTNQGFTNIQVARGRNWFVFSGSAAQIQSAFGTEIHRYNVNGEAHVANATAPKIPAVLAGIVTGIRGLDDFYLKPRAVPRVRPEYYSSTYGQFIAPGDIATIYDISPLYNSSIDGTGQKLAIMGQTDIYLSDINNFRTGFGLSSISCTTNSNGVITACNDPHFQYVLANGVEDPGVPSSGDLSESDLDLEWSGAVARGAQLIFVNTPENTTSATVNGGGVWESWYYAVDQKLAPVISLSYGVCEFGDNNIYDPATDEPGADEVELQKANSEGITFVNSSGDSGAAECDPQPQPNPNSDPYGASATGGWAVSYPASSPEVTGAGGNSLSLSDIQSSAYWGTSNNSNGGSALSYIPEQAWNDDAEFALYCQANSTNSFCEQGGSTKVTGWVPITDQQQAQEDLALAPNYDGISASGGGLSNCEVQNTSFTACVSGFPQPSWQTVTISGQTKARFTPDVSFLASPNFPGYVFCTELSELGDSGTGSSCANGIADAVNNYLSIIGGTSASAPMFAGIVTLLNESLSASGGLGNVNSMLYQVAANTSNQAFHQVTSGTNTVYCTGGTPGSPQPSSVDCPSTGVLGFNASTDDSSNGYNLVTGLGSVDVNNLSKAWAAAIGGFSLTASSINPANVLAGNSLTASITVAPSNGSNFSGTVSFSCANVSGITCSFNPTSVSGGSGSTTVTISVALNVAGSESVSVTGTSGSTSASTAVIFTVTASNVSFTLISNLGSSGTLSVTQGQTATVNLTVSSTNGFTTTSGGNTTTVLPLTYTCSSSPAILLSNCTFSPTNPSQATAVTVNITTNASTSGQARPFDRNTRIFYAALLPGLFGIVFIRGSRRRWLHGRRILGLILVLGASTLWLGSCGGSSNSSTGTTGTTPGNYTVTIKATTGGSSPISNSYQFTLTVTQ